MEWLWKHKLVLLLGGAAILYFIYNPLDDPDPNFTVVNQFIRVSK